MLGKRIKILLLVFLLGLAGLLGAGCTQRDADLHGYEPSSEITDTVALIMQGAKEAVIIELRPDKAPLTVANFQELVAASFYDGLTFHRVVQDFVIQGGDPLGNGRGGPGYTIKGEFSLNKVSNDLNHERGSLAMARSKDYDSAGSQFYICLKDLPSLDREYAVFGRVSAGMAVVDQIAAVKTSGSPEDRPLQKQVIEKIIFVKD